VAELVDALDLGSSTKVKTVWGFKSPLSHIKDKNMKKGVRIQLQDLTVAFKEKKLKEEMDKLARELRKEVSIPGFRKGKVPIDIIKTRFGGHLRAESLQKLIQDKMVDIINEYEPFIYGPPVVKNLDESTEEVRLEISLDVPPKIDLDLSAIKIEEKDKEKININEELEKLREINSELKSVNREVRKGDIVFINIKKGKEVIHNYSWEVGEDKFSKELSTLRADEKEEIDVELPENFPLKDIKNKGKKVKVSIVEIKEKVKPLLDDEFAKDLGFANLDELKKNLKKSIEEERKKGKKDVLIDKVLTKALELAGDFPVSPTLVKLIDNQGLNDVEVEKSAKKAALIDAIALKEKMTIAEEELDKWLDKIAESEEETFENMREEDAIRFVKQSILREKTLDFLVNKARKEDSSE
jgi:trigger factor